MKTKIQFSIWATAALTAFALPIVVFAAANKDLDLHKSIRETMKQSKSEVAKEAKKQLGSKAKLEAEFQNPNTPSPCDEPFLASFDRAGKPLPGENSATMLTNYYRCLWNRAQLK